MENHVKKTGNFIRRLLATIHILEELNTEREAERERSSVAKRIQIAVDIADKSRFETLAEILREMTLFHGVVAKGVEDMERLYFSDTPSVDGKFIGYTFEVEENQYGYLQKNVDLEKHTFNVVREVLSWESGKIQSYEKDIVIILALFHDFGKNDKVKEAVIGQLDRIGGLQNVANFKHNHYSAHYLHSLFLKLYPNEQEIAESLKRILIAHHQTSSYHYAKPDANLLAFLKLADEGARRKELIEFTQRS